jgi:MoxR-like ATPase
MEKQYEITEKYSRKSSNLQNSEQTNLIYPQNNHNNWRQNTMSLQEKVRKIYTRIRESGLYVAADQGIKFGKTKSYELNLNGSESIKVSAESYNAPLLFSLFTGIRKGGSQILFGPPGAGKTTTAELTGHFICGQDVKDIQNATIYGHPEHTESSMIARLHTGKLTQGIEDVIPREFVKSKVKIIDEVNRLPPGKLSIGYQLVDRRFVKYLSEIIETEDGPLYATANAPDSGNYPLPIPFLDRFDVAVVVNQLNPVYLDVLLDKGDGNTPNNYEKLLEIPKELEITQEELDEGRAEIEKVGIDSNSFYFLINFIAGINYCDKAGVELEHKTKAFAMNKKPGEGLCANCHYKGNVCAYTSNDLSARTFSSTMAYAKTMAWFRGKKTVSLEDIEQVIPYTTWHKIHPTRHAFEAEQAFENDRIGLVKHLVDQTKREYAILKPTFKEYEGIIDTLQDIVQKPTKTKAKKLETQVQTALEELKKLDSVSKYPIAIFLSQVLGETIC